MRKPTAQANATSVDWRTAGVITPVKNQGQCGSCWAFGATETIESQWVLDGQGIWEFSAQQINSCTTTSAGCNGGNQIDAYNYVNSTVGLAAAVYAPYLQNLYKSSATISCSTIDLTQLVPEYFYIGPYAQVSGYEFATTPCTGKCATQDLNTLAANILQHGPASISVNAGKWGDYVGGVLTVDGCGSYNSLSLDHAVQLVGYDSVAGYWIVKNSWATNWGENGYIRLAWDNACGYVLLSIVACFAFFIIIIIFLSTTFLSLLL